MRSLIVSIIFIFQFSTCARTEYPAGSFTPEVSDHPATLGDTTLTILVSVYNPSSNLVFTHLHDDEQTAKDATHIFLEQNGGKLISIQNNGQRLIRFPKDGKKYTFDPNRMFTARGINESLKLFQPPNAAAVAVIEKFAASFLDKIPTDGYIISVHNNTDGKYSIQSYMPEGELAGEAAQVHISQEMDPDDFVFTTDSHVFTRLQKQNISVVLQRTDPATDDGSLSILFGTKGRPYTNIEAEHGHFDVQLRLLKAVANIITSQ